MIRVPFERYQRDAAGIKFGQEIQSSRGRNFNFFIYFSNVQKLFNDGQVIWIR